MRKRPIKVSDGCRRGVPIAAAAALWVIIAGCASAPVPPVAVVSMTSAEAAAADGFPARNTVWRLDEGELTALGPIEPAPDPPPAPVYVVRDPVYPVVISPSVGYYDSGWRFGVGFGRGPYWPRYRPYGYYHR